MAVVGQQRRRPAAGVSCAWPVSRGGTGKQRRAAAVQAGKGTAASHGGMGRRADRHAAWAC